MADTPSETRVISHTWLLAFVGALAVMIPIVLLVISALRAEVVQQPSISHFYYTPMRDLLMGLLFAVAVFLFAYTGYPPKPDERVSDRQLSLAAGIGLACVVVFPTPPLPDSPAGIPSIAVFLSAETVNWLHRIGAVVFMTSLGVMSLVNFRRSMKNQDGTATTAIATEDLIYRIAGLVMLGCVLAMILQALMRPDGPMFFANATFWFESAGIFAFGISWLVKTKVLRRLM
jgi:hypothetical protein